MMRTRVKKPGATNDEDEASNDNAGDDDGNDVDNDGDGNDGDGDDAEDEVGNDGDVGKPCSSHGAYTRGHHDPKHGFFRDGPELGDVKVEQPAIDDDNAHQAWLQHDLQILATRLVRLRTRLVRLTMLMTRTKLTMLMSTRLAMESWQG